MCLTDATNLIPLDSKDAKQRKALTELRRKMIIRKVFMTKKIRDIDRALKKVNRTLARR